MTALPRLASAPSVARGGSTTAAVVVLLLAAAGCGRQEFTQAKLERDFARTYANLVEVERSIVGRPASAGRASASCARENPNAADAGPGEWRCRVSRSGPPSAAQEYEVELKANGCWRARRRGFRAPTIRAATTGRDVPAPTYGFDGCLAT